MEMISEIEADLMQLDPGMAYTAGEYFTMVPLAAEKYDTCEKLLHQFKEVFLKQCLQLSLRFHLSATASGI